MAPTINPPPSGSNYHTPNYPHARSPWIHAPPIPENEQLALSPLGAQCALSIAQVIVELAPVPGIGLLLEPLTQVFQAVERARVNKEQWKLLQGRCVMVMRIAGAQVTNYGQECYPGLQQATQLLEETLKRITERAQHFNTLNEIVALIQFQIISDEIRMLFSELDSCLGLFSYATDVAQSQWLGEFQAVQGQEMAELKRVRDLLTTMNSTLDGIDQTQDRLLEAVEVLKQELFNKSDILQNQATTTVQNYVDAQQIVRTILAVTKLRLPPRLLLGRQCNLDSTAPIKTGITCDIYVASFLGGEKVAKKVFRIGMSDQEFVKRYAERFLRVVSLWSEFRSDYNLPLYGVGMEAFEGDRHFQLYTISPLMKNFDAITYLKKYRNNPGMKQGILRIITDAARGLQYLHKCNPPIVHSGMRGDNILITDSGGAILGGFGLMKVLESKVNNKIPPAVMTGETESQRWMAPEVFAADSPELQTLSDVWGWAMAALEIVSGSIPYHLHKQALTVMLKVCQGHPRRKDHIHFEDYAHQPDEMWGLLESCWAMDPSERPTMDDVVMSLEDIATITDDSWSIGQEFQWGMENNHKEAEVVRSEEMSARDMFECLIEHGCLDLTQVVDLNATSEIAVAGGGYGDIWKGRLLGNVEIAIKVWRLDPEAGSDTKGLKRAMRELYNWSKTNHENVHELLGVIMFRDRLGMVSEWMENGNLQRYTAAHKDVDRYNTCIQVSKAIQYLHRNDMVHGDIKACNILVSPEGIPKLTDFDHSIVFECSLAFSNTTNQCGGTIRWMAPELLDESGHKSRPADIYALGMTLLEIITGEVPYSEYPQTPQVVNALSSKRFPKRGVQFEDERGRKMWDLLVRCWDRNPAKRPTADELVLELQSLIAETAKHRSQALVSTKHFKPLDACRILGNISGQKIPETIIAKQRCLGTDIVFKTGVSCNTYPGRFVGGKKIVKKVFRMEEGTPKAYVERVMKTATLWREFQSDYILPLHGVGVESFDEDRRFQLYMVSPLMANYDAVTHLGKGRNDSSIKQHVLRILLDAALGLEYLHNRDPPVVHSNIRGDNVLIADSGEAKLGGFGLIQELERSDDGKFLPTAMAGKTESRRWMAPELFFDNKTPRLHTPSDVWGWGMFALEIISDSIPYYWHTQDLTVMLRILEGPPTRNNYTKFESYAYRPDELWDLLEKCWAREPSERPTMSAVVVRLKEIREMPEHRQI